MVAHSHFRNTFSADGSKGEATETTKLISSTESEQDVENPDIKKDEEDEKIAEENVDGDNDAEYEETGNYILDNYMIVPESGLYKGYLWFSGAAATTSIVLFALQLFSIFFLEDRPKEKAIRFFTEDMVRVFTCIVCLAFFLTELPLTSHMLSPLQNWMYRGFFYCMIASICAEIAASSLYANFPNLPGFGHTFVVFLIQVVSSIMFGIGGIYFFLGIFCMRGVVDSISHHMDRLGMER